MAKNININLEFGSISRYFKNNLEVVFALALLAILVLEGFVVKSSVDLISQSKPEQVIGNGTGVRINFTNYDAVVSRIDNSFNYMPPVENISNPFTPPAPASQNTP